MSARVEMLGICKQCGRRFTVAELSAAKSEDLVCERIDAYIRAVDRAFGIFNTPTRKHVLRWGRTRRIHADPDKPGSYGYDSDEPAEDHK
jgi:hypothetical protein